MSDGISIYPSDKHEPPPAFTEATNLGALDGKGSSDDSYCPTSAEHLRTFPEHLLEGWSAEEYLLKPSNCELVERPISSYTDYANLHPTFQKRWDREIVFVKCIVADNRCHSAVVWYKPRCQYCIMVGNAATAHYGRKPCCDPFVEARDGKGDYSLPGVVALFKLGSGKIVWREDWCWETLSDMKEVLAVYSKPKESPDVSFMF